MNDFNNTLPEASSHVRLLPRFETLGPLLIEGLRELLDDKAEEKIPLLWESFLPIAENMPHPINNVKFGLCVQADKTTNDFYYTAGCQVEDFTHLPQALSPVILPSSSYAVFNHTGHVSRLRDTINEAFDEWLPNSTYSLVPQNHNLLHFFERYGEQFNPQTGCGDIEVWLPIIKK